jgi:hypothetical protein
MGRGLMEDMNGLIHPVKPIPQLYGDPYGEHEPNSVMNSGSHKGSCLSASFEVIDAYQGKGNIRSYTTISCYPGKAQPNCDEHTYTWNQATLHHYVWGSKKRLLDFTTSKISSRGNYLNYSVATFSALGKKPTWTMNRVQHFDGNDLAGLDFWSVAKYALYCNRLPLITVRPIRMLKPRSFDENSNEIDGDWISLPTDLFPSFDPPGSCSYKVFKEKGGFGPVYRVMEGGGRQTGHAMVISGFMIQNKDTDSEERYVRLIDPAPSMNLRASPIMMYEPNESARDPRNHIKWVRWKDLEPFIREEMGILIFSKQKINDHNFIVPENMERIRGHKITW